MGWAGCEGGIGHRTRLPAHGRCDLRASPPAAANEAILCFLAGVTTGSTEGTVQALDAATGLLCRLRSAIGLEFVPDLTSD